MSKIEKLIKRFLSKPKDFTFLELKALLNAFDYIDDNQGKTSGSRIAFINYKTKHIIRIHKPHPGNELKAYQVELIYQELKDQGVLL